MLFNFKYHLTLTLFLSFFILNHCQFQEASKNHGIVFLENRANKLIINSTNKNDVINIIGNPHSKSISSENQWIYIERILSKGEYHKLGQNILKSNNEAEKERENIIRRARLMDYIATSCSKN